VEYPNDFINKIIQGDCLEVMKELPDKSIDLILTDPPYGINVIKSTYQNKKTKPGKSLAHKRNYNDQWDASIPGKQYFEEMMRISKNQIIFGGNYFVEYLTNSPCWIVWDKDNGENDFADCELAWTSFKSAVRKFKYRWNGMLQENMKNKEARFHPTQKPVALMEWILQNYSTADDVVLDCFSGGGSTLVASQKLGRKFIGIEISPAYCEIARQRLRQQVLI
jgi:site-specific DNA-methyltransferase (adenine-specific)